MSAKPLGRDVLGNLVLAQVAPPGLARHHRTRRLTAAFARFSAWRLTAAFARFSAWRLTAIPESLQAQVAPATASRVHARRLTATFARFSTRRLTATFARFSARRLTATSAFAAQQVQHGPRHHRAHRASRHQALASPVAELDSGSPSPCEQAPFVDQAVTRDTHRHQVVMSRRPAARTEHDVVYVQRRRRGTCMAAVIVPRQDPAA